MEELYRKYGRVFIYCGSILPMKMFRARILSRRIFGDRVEDPIKWLENYVRHSLISAGFCSKCFSSFSSPLEYLETALTLLEDLKQAGMLKNFRRIKKFSDIFSYLRSSVGDCFIPCFDCKVGKIYREESFRKAN